MQIRFNPSYKIVMFGAKGVGKTALVNQLTKKSFDNLDPTTSCYNVHFTQEGDFPGEMTVVDQPSCEIELVQNQAPSVFNGADAALLVFSLSKNDIWSYGNIAQALANLKGHFNGPIILVGNKVDVGDDQRYVNDETIVNFAKENNLTYKQVSAKHYNDVADVFQKAVEEILCVRLRKDVEEAMKKVGPSRVPMRDDLLRTLEKSKSFKDCLAATQKCGEDAQKDHTDRSGARWWFGYGSLFHEVSHTKTITDKLIAESSKKVGGSILSLGKNKEGY